MNVWHDFVRLFSGMGLVEGIALAAGLIFCVIEITNPDRGLFAVTGGACIVLGMILRIMNGGTIAMLFFMILICSFILITVYLVMIRLSRYTILLKTPSLASAYEETDDGKDYYFLLGLEALTDTDLDPLGKIIINNNTAINAVSKAGFIAAGSRVMVVEVEGSKIIVKQIEG